MTDDFTPPVEARPTTEAPVGIDAVEAEVSEQTQVRLGKRARLLAEGTEPYPVEVGRTTSLAEVRAQWGHLTAGEETDVVVGVAGRVIFLRNTGKLCFATIQDGFTAENNGERLQVMISLAEVGADRLEAWKSDVDLGDFIAVTGRVIASKRGELSVMATQWSMAAKALRPLPVLHKDLSEETRVRQRYVDLIVRDEAREMVRTRAAVTRAIRRVLDDEGYLEVETPVLQLIHGGAAARPFITHLNAFDTDMYMRIALELYLKRVMVGGADKVYEMGRIFRNEGIDSSHSAEFTMLEFYAAWGDQHTGAATTRRLIQESADAALGRRTVVVGDTEIDLDGEWRWAKFYDLVSEAVGETVDPGTPLETLKKYADDREIVYDPKWLTSPIGQGKMAMELYSELVEHHLMQPTYVCDFPAVAQPLARPHREDPRLVEAWDLIIGGVERGTGFSELIDPVVQREVLTAQSLRAAQGDPEAMELDEDFLRALEYGVPPMGGVGLGIDRTLMLLTGAGIRETILFPLLKPEG
ncbi:MAG: lysine--tRNA ligase [Propionibacteriaceae bacterium]|jgi:lysyl-tRNA synthetase class 2|nr:lysine--tRNA ligase [Propionibacteriaceae bacterium]